MKNERTNSRRHRLHFTLVCLFAISLAAPIARALQAGVVMVVNAPASGFAYAYGPAIIYTQGLYHAYFCSTGNGSSSDMDDIRHAVSSNFVNWSSPSVVLTPTVRERSNCDPSVVLFNAGDGPYYYIFYSGSVVNVQTVNFVARSASPDGPFLKYTDRGTWEQSPPDAHIITWPITSTSNMYGAGEPSVVVKNGTLYMWYTDTTNPSMMGVSNQYLVTSVDAVHWSAPVLTTVSDGSIDVKYDPTLNQFEMIEIANQFLPQAALEVRTSKDGVNWSQPQVFCDSNCLPHFANNPGWLGDDQGHVMNLGSVFIAYGSTYTLNPAADTWGKWDLWGALYAVAPVLPTAPAATTTAPSPPTAPVTANASASPPSPSGCTAPASAQTYLTQSLQYFAGAEKIKNVSAQATQCYSSTNAAINTLIQQGWPCGPGVDETTDYVKGCVALIQSQLGH